MAHVSALAVVSEAVTALLSESRPSDLSTASCQLIGSATITATGTPEPQKPPTFGISVFPYRVSYNLQRRLVQPRVSPEGNRFRPSLLVDLHLLVSAWASSGADQMRLLAWAARILEDTPALGSGFLNRGAQADNVVFGPDESVELVAEPLSLQDLVSIWEINKASMQPSLGWVARMIALDSEVALPATGIVRSRNFDYGGMPTS
jgi:hypothetical protein